MQRGERPSLVFVLNGLGMGGAEAQLVAILEADPVALAEVRVTILTLSGIRHEPFIARLAALGVPVRTIDRSEQSFPRFFARLVAFFRRERPAVVHTFLAGTASTWGRATALLAGVPVVMLSDLSLAPTVTRTQRWLDPWLHRRTARFLPNARPIARRLEHEGAPPDRVRLLRNGVDLQRFDPAKWDAARIAERRARWAIPEDAVVAGFLGRLQRVKRPDLALEAVMALPVEHRPDRLLFAGDGPMASALHARIEADAWARDHVRLLGTIDDVPGFLAAIDLLVLCSDTEGFPNAVLEALAMGCPVVATRVSDVPELLGDAGASVAPGDRDALAEAIARLVSLGSEERTELAREGQARVRSELGLRGASQAFWDAHRDLLRSGARPEVALLLPSLGGGGAERVVLDLAGAFAERGVRTELVLATARREATGWSRCEVASGVTVVELNARRMATAIPALIGYLRRRRPVVLLSTLEHANAAAALAVRAAPGVRWVLREANTVEQEVTSDGLRGRALRWAMRHGYRGAAVAVAVSSGVARSLVDDLGVRPERVRVIENPAITPRLQASASAPCEHPWFAPDAPPVVVAMGRLAAQKRFDTLIRAFARARRRTPCRLVVMGEGPERTRLEALADELGVASDVELSGWIREPFGRLARAGAFVLSSAWEGMPNVLIQARALGLPVVATDCPSGPAEILDGGLEGRLVAVGDVSAMADAIVAALATPNRPPSAAWRSRFELEAVAKRYLGTLFDDSPRRLRTMLVTTSLMRGGAENQVVALACGLRRRGHAVRVVSLRDLEAHRATLREAGVEVASLGMRRGRPDPRALLRLAREVRQWRPDVVHAHMVHANLLARLARPLAWAPVLISTAHNIDEGARWRELAYRVTDALGDLTTNVAEAGVERFVRVGAAPAGRIEAMPNGVDVDAWTHDPEVRRRFREELRVGERFVWLAVGRLEPQKDLATMLRAASTAIEDAQRTRSPSNDGVSGRAVLLIVGEGPERRQLEILARSLGLSQDDVRFLGPRDDVAALLSAADGYLMSSAWEGLPLVLLEAAAAGLPIVATDVGGNREIVRSDEVGELVPARDPVALSVAMTRIVRSDDATRAAMGRAARSVVRNRYAIHRVVQAWEARYRELLESDVGIGGTS